MTKLTIDDLVGDMPEAMIVEALDDDRDGYADEAVFNAALKSANDRAEAVFGGPVPARYAKAADYAVRVFLLDLIHRRHGDADENNPFASVAEEQVNRLRALASGTESIDATSDGAVIAKPAKIYNTLGVMS